MYRSHYIGDIPAFAKPGESVTLAGWVNKKRNHGKIIFIELRDDTGTIQVKCENNIQEIFIIAKDIKSEYVLQISGILCEKPSNMRKMDCTNSDLEVDARSITILNRSNYLPFPIEDSPPVHEDTRLKYRYLDLRRPEMKKQITLRHQLTLFIRNWLNQLKFIEIETPILLKPTLGGAREFLVPSRLYPGEFFALPQSPQQIKQLLAISGFERYFQIARCFRDEDARSNRQIEFTILDLCMSFADEFLIKTTVQNLLEALVGTNFKERKICSNSFLSLSYSKVIEKYGISNPDTRFDLSLVNLDELLVAVSDASWLNKVSHIVGFSMDKNEVIRCICLPGLAYCDEAIIYNWNTIAQELGCTGIHTIRVKEYYKLSGSFAEFLDEKSLEIILERTKAQPGDLIIMALGDKDTIEKTLGNLRNKIGRDYFVDDENAISFIWVQDMPLFKFDLNKNALITAHHPFIAPHDDDCIVLESAPLLVRGKAYELTANGIVLGSGSIYINKPEMQLKIFRLLGIDDSISQTQFKHLFAAMQFGTPPHAGISIGMDTLVAFLTNAPSLRDVIAFPKGSNGRDLILEAPSAVQPANLRDLHIKIT